MEMVSSVPVAQQAMTFLMKSLFSRSSVCFSVCLKAPECASEHLNLSIFLGEHAPKPP